MDANLAEMVRSFLKRYPRLAHPAGAQNQCQIAIDQLIGDLRSAGRLARKIWLKGHRRRPSDAHPRADSTDTCEHAVVLVDQRILIDVTRRQFDPKADVPAIYESIDEAGVDWKAVTEDPERRGAFQPLPERA